MAVDPDGAVGAGARPAGWSDRRRSWSSSIRGGRRRPRRADVHLAPRPGTNLAAAERDPADPRSSAGWIDSDFIRDHTVGLRDARHARPNRGRPSGWSASPASRARRSRRPPRSSGPRRRWCRPACRASTSRSRRPRRAVQVNNLHLDPRPDRQAGLDGLPDERPADRAEHPRVRRERRVHRLPQLAEPRARRRDRPGSGTSSRRSCRTWTPPTHAMQMFQLAETGSIRFLWIIATNPAVSPARSCARIRRDPRPRRTCSWSCRTPS